MPEGTTSPPRDALDVTIVLPIFNESGHLRDEIERITASMDASEFAYEIVVVDDGSDDGSTAELKAFPDIRVIRHSRNRGSGAARRTGTLAARGDVVVWTDVDMTYPNDRIPELVRQLPGWDQVVGARSKERGTKKVLRVPAKWFIRRLASYLVDRPIPDLNSGFRAFRREVALQYLDDLPDGFSCVTTLTMSFLANGYSIRYEPIEYSARQGTSKFRWFRDTRRYLQQVVRMTMSYNPLRIFLPIAAILGLVGTGKLIYDFVDKDFGIAANTLLLLFAGALALAIGLLADLVVIKTRRPRRVDPA